MRISFDLDDTLICYAGNVPAEPRPAWFRTLLAPREPMRLGTRELAGELKKLGWEIWVYTTSYRTPASIRRWMKGYGIDVTGIVNQTIHERKMAMLDGQAPSKHPRLFGIDLHVDDCDGVKLEGKWFGFDVVVVEPSDVGWTKKVLEAVRGCGSESRRSSKP